MKILLTLTLNEETADGTRPYLAIDCPVCVWRTSHWPLPTNADTARAKARVKEHGYDESAAQVAWMRNTAAAGVLWSFIQHYQAEHAKEEHTK